MIQIGAPALSAEPLGLLTDCHRRIESALRVLQDAAKGPASPERASGVRRALEFLRVSAPKHTADEEESLFPRLRALGEPLVELDALEAEHEQADALHEELDQLGEAWLAGSASPRLRECLAELAELYARHIAVEETIVFPLAKQRLALAEQEIVRDEMKARRAR